LDALGDELFEEEAEPSYLPEAPMPEVPGGFVEEKKEEKPVQITN
jgi:hypothetical protein